MRATKRFSLISAFAAFMILAACGSATSAFAAIHELKLAGPGTSPDDPACVKQANDIANEFGRLSGVTIIEVACQSDIVAENLAIIRYAAPDRINVYNSSADQFDHLNNGYDTVEECSAGLATEVDIYSRHTGISPFAAYCFNSMTPGSGWVGTFKTAIYGINPNPGLPASRKHRAGATITLPPLDIPAVKTMATGIAQRSGIDIVSVSIGQGLSTWEISAAFYGTKNVNILAEPLGNFAAGTSCEENATALNQVWSTSGLIDAGFFCMDASRNARRLGMFWWSSHSFSGEDFIINRLDTDYADIESCQAGKAKLVDSLTRAGEHVVAALCSHAYTPAPGKPLPFQVTVITK